MQTETVRRRHRAPVGMATSQTQATPSAGGLGGPQEPSVTAGGDADRDRKSAAVLIQLKGLPPFDPEQPHPVAVTQTPPGTCVPPHPAPGGSQQLYSELPKPGRAQAACRQVTGCTNCHVVDSGIVFSTEGT